MSTAATATQIQQRFIALSSIKISKTNPRKTFDKAKLEELTGSIKLQGVLQPILVRPINGEGSFEIVAGERRYKASQAAGLKEIPAMVRELTDAQALELQVIENNQREDLHPLEEAEGYEALLKCRHADGKPYMVDDIAAKVGKSKSYVYQKLKLCALCPEARKAFYDGKIDFSRGLLVARIGHHDTQRQALKTLLEPSYGGDLMSYRQAHHFVLQNFMLALKEAPFDIKDANLVAKAGACGPCPKRSGNQPDLFGDVKNADTCTDPKCFDDKRQAHYSVAVKELQAKGHKVLAGDAAKKAVPHWDSPSNYSREQLGGGYMRLTDTTYASGRSKQVAQLLGSEYEPILIQHPGTGVIIKAATQQAVTAAVARTEKENSPAKGKKASTTRTNRAQAPQETEEEQFRKALFMHICTKLPTKLGAEELRTIAAEVMLGDVEVDLVQTLLLPTKTQERSSPGVAQAVIDKALPKLEADGLSRLIVALLLSRHLVSWNPDEKKLIEAAKRYGVDVAAVTANVKEARAAKAAAEKKPAPPTAKKAKPTKKAKKR